MRLKLQRKKAKEVLKGSNIIYGIGFGPTFLVSMHPLKNTTAMLCYAHTLSMAFPRAAVEVSTRRACEGRDPGSCYLAPPHGLATDEPAPHAPSAPSPRPVRRAALRSGARPPPPEPSRPGVPPPAARPNEHAAAWPCSHMLTRKIEYDYSEPPSRAPALAN